MSKARTVWTTALSTRSSDAPAPRSAKKRSPNAVQRRGALAGRRRPEVVDDVVGVAAERVQGVDVVALDRRQHRRRPVVRRAVALVQPLALGVALLQRRDASSSRSIARDAGGGELAGHEHHRHADAGHGRRADEHEARHPAIDVARAGTDRSGGTCGRGRTACPAPCPGPPSRAGRRPPRSRRRPGSPPRRPGPAAGPRRARGGASSRRARRGSAPARGRTASSSRRARATASSSECSVTRIDGSAITSPSRMIASNDVVPLPSEVDVVVRRAGRRQPADAGDPQQARRRVAPAAGGPRRVDPAEQRAVGDGQVGVADDDVGGQPLVAAELDAVDRAVARRAGSASPARRSAARRPPLVTASARPVAMACIPPTGANTPSIESMYVMTEYRARASCGRDAGVHRLEPEDALQPLVVEERGHLAVRACRTRRGGRAGRRPASAARGRAPSRSRRR